MTPMLRVVTDEPAGEELAVTLDEICREGWLVIDTGQGDNRLWTAGPRPGEPYAE